MVKFIGYYRVSTQRQGRSGLGLEAQETAVAAYVQRARGRLVEAFTEVESGRKSDKRRPVLREALERARRERATLVIAKLDRLARSVHFLAGLMESGCEFVAVDMPEANRMVLHIMAAMAEQEARAISERTKVALAAAKRRGVRLGRPENLTRAAQRKGARVRRSESLRRYRVALELIQTWRGRGLTLWECARRLDEVGLETARGGSWTASTVGWLLKRAA